MRFDRTRPVPWKRLLTEWAVIAVVIAAVSWFATDNRQIESYLSIVLAGAIYVLFGALLAKLGYARKTLRQLRAEAAAPAAPRATTPAARPRPAPTSRTSGGGNRPARKRR